MKLIIATIISLSLLGCVAVKLSQESSHIRAITEAEKPNCKYISNVATWDGWFVGLLGDWTYDQAFENGFKAAMNEVASKGGDAYAIVRSDVAGQVYEIEVWRCGWRNGPSADKYQEASQLQEISSNERMQCDFIKSIAEGSNWGVTKSRNFKGAKKDVLNHVQEAGGDSYYIVRELKNKYGVGLIVEAWRCNLDS